MLQIKNLSKSFDDLRAVDNISLEVKQGEIFGFLGPNGAGKTTTISMIAGLLKPDSGQILVNSLDTASQLKAIHRIMGVVPQDMAFYEELTAKENLIFWGRLHGVDKKTLEERIDIYLHKTGLKGRENEPLKKYSGGMKRRVNLIIGLIHEPRLLLLDEPTLGIDVQTKLNIYQIIKEISGRDTTMLLTTHNLLEAEELCQRIAILDAGKILAMGTMEELVKIVGEKDIAVITGSFDVDLVQRSVAGLSETSVISLTEGKIVLSLEASQKIPQLLETFFREGITVDDIAIKQPNLESVFLKLTGRELRE